MLISSTDGGRHAPPTTTNAPTRKQHTAHDSHTHAQHTNPHTPHVVVVVPSGGCGAPAAGDTAAEVQRGVWRRRARVAALRAEHHQRRWQDSLHHEASGPRLCASCKRQPAARQVRFFKCGRGVAGAIMAWELASYVEGEVVSDCAHK